MPAPLPAAPQVPHNPLRVRRAHLASRTIWLTARPSATCAQPAPRARDKQSSPGVRCVPPRPAMARHVPSSIFGSYRFAKTAFWRPHRKSVLLPQTQTFIACSRRALICARGPCPRIRTKTCGAPPCRSARCFFQLRMFCGCPI